MPWRPEDETLLRRLEDEAIANDLFAHFLRGAGDVPVPPLHPRAGGLVAELRRRPGGPEAVAIASRDIAPLARIAAGALESGAVPPAPELAHHLALFWAKVARALEDRAPDAAAGAWVRSFALWFFLAEERIYLERLVAGVLGEAANRASETSLPPEKIPLEQVAEVARRAEAAARDLAPPGRAALLALGRTDEAAHVAGASAEQTKQARVFAERRRASAIETALGVVADELDEANLRGDLSSAGRGILLRAITVWSWSSHDFAVEHFVASRLETIGWELHRARNWVALRQLLEPFRGVIESFAKRVECDPTLVAYASVCAQMFVFLAELADGTPNRIAYAERAVRICPTHRNGRLVLAAALCDEATTMLRAMVVVARRDELAAIEAKLARAEALYPRTSSLPEAKQLLERVKSGKLKI